MKITYYLEVISSWCHWAEPAWAELKLRYAGRVEFDWKVALMRPEDYPTSRTQCDWFYRRSGGTTMRSPYMLNSGWLEADRRGRYLAPNLVAEAARGMGATGDEVRLAIATAALRDGRKVGDFAESVAIAAKAGKLNAKRLRAAAQSPEIAARVAASTAEFHAHQINLRPAFVLQNAIGDKVVFSGLVRIEPLAATIEAMLADTQAYAAHAAHHPPAPKS
jgi:predicted DsbA family dithiol-disulfide isomerase